MVKTFKEFEEQQKQEEVKATQTTDTTTDNIQQTQTTQTTEGKEVVKDDVVIINGKERPLKNYEAEIRRKLEDELREERVTQPQTQQVQQQAPVNYLEQAYAMAENEMATTGKAVPVQTIMQIANSLARQNMETFFKTKDQADKTIRSFKRSLRKEDDFVENEDEFDNLVDQLKPDQINAPTLEVLWNATRGKKVPEIKKKIKETAKEQVEKDTVIVGNPTQATGSSNASPALTSAQQADLAQMNKDNDMGWTPKEYLNALNNKQIRFKAQGAKNIPQTLVDSLIK